ncbi:MAG: hypothetical protein WAZ94_15275 [Phycisphaerales bacterium]|nr:hypothetical protein [Chloroflexota bacterium]
MASLVAWCVYQVQPDGSLLPATGLPIGPAGMRFIDFIDRGLVQRAQPTIVELGGGQYGFLPTDADEEVGVAWLVDNGPGAFPQRQADSVTTGGAAFAAWHLEDDAGDLWAGAPSSLASYVSMAGPRPSPGVLAVRPYLMTVTPTQADLIAGVSFRSDSPAGASPEFMQDALVLLGSSDFQDPVVSVISPPTGTSVLAETPLAISITDNVALRRALIVARFSDGSEEVVHTGERFAQAYLAYSQRTATSGGWQYSIRRTAGWPKAPTLDIYAIDTSGREAA